MKGVVAAGHDLTAEAGAEVLRAGGNAFDAAVAACFASFVAEPILTSPAGGGFMMARTPDGTTRLYDFFTDVPGRGVGLDKPGVDFFSVFIDFAGTLQELQIGRGSAAVPGCVAGLAEVYRNHCTMPLAELLGPAIGYAREGVRLNSYQAYFNHLLEPMLTCSDEASGIYAPGGRFLGEGEVLRNPAMADTFEHMAGAGLEDFYRGDVAARILEGFGEAGYITGEDLEGYRVVTREPLKVDYRGRTIYTNPPPSSGGCLVAFALKLIEGYDMGAMGHNTVDSLKLMSEAMRVTNEARRNDFNRRVYEPGMAGEFLSPTRVEMYSRYLDIIEKGPGPERVNHLRGPDSTGNTTQVSVVDGAGNAASLTTTTGIGCGVMIPGTGIMMNNMLGEEDVNPLGFHAQAPGSRMSSMMAPTIVVKGDAPEVVLGSGGSKRIRSAILQVLVNLIDFGLGVDTAVNSPRIHYDLEGTLNYEHGVDPRVAAGLTEAGLKTRKWDTMHMFFGGVHTVVATDRGLTCAGDTRRGGACVKCE